MYKQIIVASALLLGLVSCEKSNAPIENVTKKGNEAKSLAFGLNVKMPKIVSFKRTGGEARAVNMTALRGNNPMVLKLTSANSLTFRWTTFKISDKQNTYQSAFVSSANSPAYDVNNPSKNYGTGYTLFDNGKKVFLSYYENDGTNSGNFNGGKFLANFAADQHACIMVGGEQYSSTDWSNALKQYWGFAGGNLEKNLSENRDRRTIPYVSYDTNKDLGFPMMTKMLPLTVAKSTAQGYNPLGDNVATLPTNATLEARGCVLALAIKNELNNVTLKTIEVLGANANIPNENVQCPWFFDGSFDMNVASANQKVPFVQHTTPTNGKVFQANNANGQVLTKGESNGRFYLWGYPNSAMANQAIYLKLTYSNNGQDEVAPIQKLNAPVGGWADGAVYTATLVIADTAIDPEVLEFNVALTRNYETDYNEVSPTDDMNW